MKDNRGKRRSRQAVRKGAGLLNTLINKLPIELHLPGYNYCGPGTRLRQRLARNDKGINPLDEACKEHDIAYSESNNLVERNKADNILGNKAWERFRSKDATFGEKAAALTIAGIMKGKAKLGMGMGNRRRRRRRRTVKRVKVREGGAVTFNNAVRIAKRRVGGKFTKNKSLQNAVQVALSALKNKKIMSPKHRVIPIPKKGGILPLIPIFAALGALGSLGGGAAAVTKAITDAKNAQKQLEETKRHHKTLEASSVGKGLYLQRYKKGLGLYLKPYPKNYQ